MKFLGNMDIHLREKLEGIRSVGLKIGGKDAVISCMPDLTRFNAQFIIVKEIENVNM